jgi:NAD(P)-dependent dehydrogenase (short-subunit alcohol dehydrogenase family)
VTYLEELFSLAGKTALVTGGSTGIGRMIAECLSQTGARVLIASRRGDVCEEVAREINRANGSDLVEGFAGNIDGEDGVAALAAGVGLRADRLNILVNNAGRTWGADFESFPHDAWERVLSVNVASMFTLTQKLFPLLKASATAEDPARVVNLGSIMGTQPLGNNAYSYATSKAAVHHLTRILANELAASHVTVNALAPGPVETRMLAHTLSDPAQRARMMATVPLGRFAASADIAAATLYLCGRGGGYITGAIIPVDGGKHIAGPSSAYSEEAPA